MRHVYKIILGIIGIGIMFIIGYAVLDWIVKTLVDMVNIF